MKMEPSANNIQLECYDSSEHRGPKDRLADRNIETGRPEYRLIHCRLSSSKIGRIENAGVLL